MRLHPRRGRLTCDGSEVAMLDVDLAAHDVSSMLAEVACAESADIGLAPGLREERPSMRAPRPPVPDGLQELRVHTCMATFSLGIPIDLAALVKAIPNSIFYGEHASRFATIRAMREPRYVAAIRKSGDAYVFTTYDGE